MNRREERYAEANRYLKEHHSPSKEDNDFQNAMNIAVMKAHIAASEWADKTMIEKTINWLKENAVNYMVYIVSEECDALDIDKLVNDFKKAMGGLIEKGLALEAPKGMYTDDKFVPITKEELEKTRISSKDYLI